MEVYINLYMICIQIHTQCIQHTHTEIYIIPGYSIVHILRYTCLGITVNSAFYFFDPPPTLG